MSKWIKITDKLPPLNKNVWCYVRGNDWRGSPFRKRITYHQIEAARIKPAYPTDEIVFDDPNGNKYWLSAVTHWRPLPAAPKQ